MDKVTQVNIEGHNYGFVAGQAAKGSCTSQSADWVKAIVLPEGVTLVEGMVVATLFLNGNTTGFSDAITIYSSTENVYYYDPEMTEVVTLPPNPQCYIITHISGTQYSYRAFPVADINGQRFPICDSRGKPCGGPIWSAGDTIASLYLDDKLLMLHSTTTDQVQSGSTLPVTSGAVANYKTDTIQSGNMLPVTSNAAAQAVGIQKYFNYSRGGVYEGRYILIATADGSAASVPTMSFKSILFYHNGSQYRVGTIAVDITFECTQTSLDIKGITDVPLNLSNDRLPAIVVTKSGTTSYLYIECTEAWFGFDIFSFTSLNRITIPTTFTQASAYTGTIQYNSRTDGNSKISLSGNNSYVLGEIDTGGTWIDGKKIYRRVDTWNLASMPVGNSSYQFSSSYWAQIDNVISIRIIRPKASNLLFAQISAGYRFDPSTKTLNIYDQATDWTGPFLLIFEYTKV